MDMDQMLIDELSSRKCGKTRNISEMKIENESINAAAEMAEAFNDFFTTVDPSLANKISPSSIVSNYASSVKPETYLQPTEKNIFSKSSHR